MSPAAGNSGQIFSATYSNVPVYELKANGNHVMRRRSDDWINATHILKVADLDKPARTRVLEKEVQLNTHEKIQGGYGKYQGTWIPLEKGIIVARKYNVYDILKPIFEFVPGDTSPPPAPKHTTAAAGKPKVPKPAATRKVAKPKPTPIPHQEPVQEKYNNISGNLHDDNTPDNSTIDSESIIDEGEYRGSRKRKRHDQQSEWTRRDQEHRVWANQLLDYFMLQDGDPTVAAQTTPLIPENVEVDRPIDNEGHTALHWACAMGDIDVVKGLLARKTNPRAPNIRGETPLIRASIFANGYEQGTFAKIVHLLERTIRIPDNHGGTVFHHIAYTAQSGQRAQRARHYLDVLLNKLSEIVPQADFFHFLNLQDRSGDTAFHIACRNSRRCMKAFQAFGLDSNIPNHNGETVEHYLQNRAKQRSRNDNLMLLSSSPVQGDGIAGAGQLSPHKVHASGISLIANHLKTLPSQNLATAFRSIVTSNLTYFLQAGENDLSEKDALLADTERALERANRETSGVRTSIYTFNATLDGGENNVVLAAQHQNLLSEGEKLEEQIQHRKIHDLVHHEENAPETLNATQKPDLLSELAARERLAWLLHEEQERRKVLLRETVKATADAGMSDRGAQYLKCVSKVLGMPQHEIGDVADELLRELEMAAGDGIDAMEVDGP